MELNAEKIVKGLACCSSDTADCNNCPYSEFAEGNCFDNAKKDAIALIKELTEENERLRAEQTKIKRKVLMEAASKFAGHSDYHGDAILCKLICMSEGKEVGVARPIDEVRRKENRADTVRKMQERLKMYFGTYVLGYKIPLSEALKAVNQIAKEMVEDKPCT